MDKKNNNDKEKKTVISRQFTGEVTSDNENKTIHVSVGVLKVHPKYKKQYRINKKYAVHDEKEQAKTGDKVVFRECRPLSRTKRWRLVKVIEKAS